MTKAINLWRSFLFVPGTRPDRIQKAVACGVDAIIIDLEDAVPLADKQRARETVAETINDITPQHCHIFVRINSWGSGDLLEDLRAVVSPTLKGVMLPKAAGPNDIGSLDYLLTEIERHKGILPGSVEVLPLTETAGAMMNVYAICTASERVKRIHGVAFSVPGGDFYTATGARYTRAGIETAYAGGRTVMEARAAGIQSILCGPSADVKNTDLLRETLMRGRTLGATGAVCIHPTHVPIIHEIFNPSPEDINDAVSIVDAMAAAIRQGEAAVVYNGMMVDYAHVRTSLDLLARAQAAGLAVPRYNAIDLPE